MSDDNTPATPNAQPTTPLPAAEPVAAPAPPASVATAPAPAPVAAKSPWPVLIPVLVGVGALLLGGVLGGVAGFTVGSHRGLDRGPMVEYRMPDLPGNGDRRGPQDAPNAPEGQLERGGIVTGTVSELSDDELTLELANGETVTIRIADDTPVVEADASSVDALATGDEITVVVRGDGDGNAEARHIRTGDADLTQLGGAPGR
jgi:hypothetical protein